MFIIYESNKKTYYYKFPYTSFMTYLKFFCNFMFCILIGFILSRKYINFYIINEKNANLFEQTHLKKSIKKNKKKYPLYLKLKESTKTKSTFRIYHLKKNTKNPKKIRYFKAFLFQ